MYSILLILVHLTSLYIVEFIYIDYICMVEILHHSGCCASLEMNHVGSLYTMEFGKQY